MTVPNMFCNFYFVKTKNWTTAKAGQKISTDLEYLYFKIFLSKFKTNKILINKISQVTTKLGNIIVIYKISRWW